MLTTKPLRPNTLMNYRDYDLLRFLHNIDQHQDYLQAKAAMSRECNLCRESMQRPALFRNLVLHESCRSMVANALNYVSHLPDLVGYASDDPRLLTAMAATTAEHALSGHLITTSRWVSRSQDDGALCATPISAMPLPNCPEVVEVDEDNFIVLDADCSICGNLIDLDSPVINGMREHTSCRLLMAQCESALKRAGERRPRSSAYSMAIAAQTGTLALETSFAGAWDMEDDADAQAQY